MFFWPFSAWFVQWSLVSFVSFNCLEVCFVFFFFLLIALQIVAGFVCSQTLKLYFFFSVIIWSVFSDGNNAPFRVVSGLKCIRLECICLYFNNMHIPSVPMLLFPWWQPRVPWILIHQSFSSLKCHSCQQRSDVKKY